LRVRHRAPTLDDVLEHAEILVCDHGGHDLASVAALVPERLSLVIDLGHDFGVDGGSSMAKGIRYEDFCW
jgi:hypothetical protein